MTSALLFEPCYPIQVTSPAVVKAKKKKVKKVEDMDEEIG